MAQRFVDTDKYKNLFIRKLPAPYKLLWDYINLDCDHAGIWIVDFEVAQLYLGADAPIDREEALEVFNKIESRIIEIDNKKRWYITSFIEDQYGELNPNNRVHASVLNILGKYNLIKAKRTKPLNSPIYGAKDKEKDKDKFILERVVRERELPEEFMGVFLKWLHYKRKRNEAYKDENSVTLAYKKLIKLSEHDRATAKSIIDESMSNNWAGLFPLKENRGVSKATIAYREHSHTYKNSDKEI